MALNPVSGPSRGLFLRSILIDNAAKLVYTSRPNGWPRDSCWLEAEVIDIWSLNLRGRVPSCTRHLIVWDGTGGRKKAVRGAEARGQWLALSFSFFWLRWVFVACTRAFSSCSEWGLLFVAVRGLLFAVASLVAEHGL